MAACGATTPLDLTYIRASLSASLRGVGVRGPNRLMQAARVLAGSAIFRFVGVRKLVILGQRFIHFAERFAGLAEGQNGLFLQDRVVRQLGFELLEGLGHGLQNLGSMRRRLRFRH